MWEGLQEASQRRHSCGGFALNWVLPKSKRQCCDFLDFFLAAGGTKQEREMFDRFRGLGSVLALVFLHPRDLSFGVL